MEEKDFLFLLSESKFTRFQQKAHELLKQYLLISRNWEKFPLCRSFISVYMQPVAAENTAGKASLCCKEILLLAAAAVYCRNHLFTFTHHVWSTNINKLLFHHSLCHACGAGVSFCCQFLLI